MSGRSCSWPATPSVPTRWTYINRIFSGFQRLSGDRLFGDDGAIVGGVARLGQLQCMVLGTLRGRSIKENVERNFGMPHPEGYRKALRLMQQAAKFQMPIITLVDTPGAYPGIGAEERGQSVAIARNLFEMARLPTPIIAVLTGEGGSGGALALAVADRVLILENAYYSVISPEGCSVILFKNVTAAPQAARALRISAPELRRLGIVDEIVPEPDEGAHTDSDATAHALRAALIRQLGALLMLEVRAAGDSSVTPVTAGSAPPRRGLVEAKSAEHIEQVVKEAGRLVSMLETTSVRRFCLEAGDFKIEIERAFAKGAATQAVPAGASAAPLGPGAGEAPTRHTVLAPLVGTFYRSPNAGAKPFVEVGSRVQRGQVIAIIEAMKLMNEVLADAAGVVVGILVENAQPVQYEQPLLEIDTTV